MCIKLYSLTINTLNKQRICSTSENRFPISVPKKIQNRAKQLKKRLVTRWCKSNIMQQGRKEFKHWQITCFLDFLFIYIFPKTGSLEVTLNSTLLISYLYPDIEIWDTASRPLPDIDPVPHYHIRALSGVFIICYVVSLCNIFARPAW